MKNIVSQISFGLLLLSVLIYIVGRWVIQNPMSDDMSDWVLWSGGVATLVLLFFIPRGPSLNIRRGFNTAAATIIIFLAAFGAWGLLSASGQKQFPEMAGLLPFYALILAGILVLLAVIANLLWRRRLKK
jgi:hypothetical protein